MEMMIRVTIFFTTKTLLLKACDVTPNSGDAIPLLVRNGARLIMTLMVIEAHLLLGPCGAMPILQELGLIR